MRIKKICYNCGQTASLNKSVVCPACNTIFTKISIIDGIKLTNLSGENRTEWIENKLGHPLPNKEIRKKYVEKQRQEYYRKREQESFDKQFDSYSKLEHIPKCPICGSSNINKISISTRVMKTAALGTIGAMDDAGKTWKCGNCGSKF